MLTLGWMKFEGYQTCFWEIYSDNQLTSSTDAETKNHTFAISEILCIHGETVNRNVHGKHMSSYTHQIHFMEKHFTQASLRERESAYKEHTGTYCAFIFQELSSLYNAVISHSLFIQKCWLKVAAGVRLNRLFIMTGKFQLEHRKR